MCAIHMRPASAWNPRKENRGSCGKASAKSIGVRGGFAIVKSSREKVSWKSRIKLSHMRLRFREEQFRESVRYTRANCMFRLAGGLLFIRFHCSFTYWHCYIYYKPRYKNTIWQKCSLSFDTIKILQKYCLKIYLAFAKVQLVSYRKSKETGMSMDEISTDKQR